MKIIRPMAITGVAPAAITSSNVTDPETGTVTYSGASTYALDDLVSVKQHSSTVTITYASPAVVTWTAHELVVGDRFYFTTTGALPSNLTVSYLYYVSEVVSVDTFKMSTSDGGDAINTEAFGGSAGSGTHTGIVYVYGVFQSLQAGNTNHHPRLASSSAWWQRIRSTNYYQMFNGTINQQTIGAGSIDVTITVSKAVDTIAIFNLSAVAVDIVCTDDVLGVVYNTTNTTSETINGDKEYIPDLVITDIPDLSTGTIQIIAYKSATYPVTATAIGQVLIGYAVDAGDSEYGATVGVQDFSVIEQNDYGDYDIVERTNRKTGSFQVMVPNASLTRVYRILTQQKTKKTLYIGSVSYTQTAIYGFPSDWSIIIQYPEYAVVNVDLEGLT